MGKAKSHPPPPPKRDINAVLLAGAALAKYKPQKPSANKAPKRYKKSAWSTQASENNVPSPPKYKILSSTSILVDGFKYAHKNVSETYFLTHFHSDHYGGITRHWNAGTIYCNKITARLVVQELKVDPKYIQEIEMDSPYTLISKDCKGMDVSVTFTDANHCPGAAVLYFSIGNPKRPKAPKRRILHVGDFRWNSDLFLQNTVYSRIHDGAVRLNEIYLDTTYCDPKYDFPSQDDAVAAALKCVEKEDITRRDTLFLFGAYTIGKEKVFLEVARRYKKKIFVDSHRWKVLQTFVPPSEFGKIFTRDKNETNMWVVGLGSIVNKGMKELLDDANSKKKSLSAKYTRVVGFRPSGWTFNPPKKASASAKKQTLLAPVKSKAIPDIVAHRTSGSITVYGIPYSEHSSFSELVDCLLVLRPERIIPTVSAATSRDQVDLLLAACRDETERRMYEE